MRIALAVIVLCVAAAAGLTYAQHAPAPKPDVALTPADTRPPERPQSADDAEKNTPATSQGRLIPPEQAAPAPKATPMPTGPAMPAVLRETDVDHSACLLALSILGVGYEEVAPVSESDQRDCGIARPIRVTEAGPGIAIDGGAVMRCGTARALALWTRDFVTPAAASLPGAPRLTGMVPGSTYQCRDRVGDGAGAKMSEHAYGNAIDIAAFRFDIAPDLPVQPLKEGGDMTVAFLRAVQAAACLRFTTVLGPGSNAAHDDHLHLDMARRRGGWRLCQ